MTLFLTGVAAFAALHHVWFWLRRRKDHVHFWMLALSVGTLVYLPGYGLQMSSLTPNPAILGARLQWTGGTLLIVVLFGLVNRFIGQPPPRALLRAVAGGGAAYIGCVWFTDTVLRNEGAVLVTAAGQRYWGVARGPVMFVFVPFMLAAAVYCISVLARARDIDPFERRVLLVTFTFYLLVGMNEVLYALRLIKTMRLLAPAFALLGVGFSLLLARRYDTLARENERLLEEMRVQTKTLEARNADLDAFAFTVSHDLKGPLVAIEGMAGMLHDAHAGRPDEIERHVLERIHTNVHRMTRLIADLLLFSRVGREGHQPAAVPLLDVVDGVMEELAGTLSERGIRVSRPDPVTVWGTKSQLEQVFRNLLTNAVKFLGTAPVPAIDVTAVDCGSMVECAVRDNGIGIDLAYHAKVFEMFQRLNDTQAEGTGVGLALVKKIVEANGGSVWVDSARGRGATFRFTWPKPAPG